MRAFVFILVLSLVAPSLKAADCRFILTDTFRGFITENRDRMLLLIHGGQSSMVEAYNMCLKGTEIAPPGFGVASLDFSPSTLGGREVEEAVLMARWLRDKGAKTVGIMGVSHGGYIALMAAPHVKPDFLVVIAAPTDLDTMYSHFKSHKEMFKNWIEVVEATKRECEKEGKKQKLCLEELSPVNYAGFMEFPVLIVHGTEDKMVPLSQSLKLVGKLLTFKNHRVWMFTFPAGHDVDFTSSPVRDVIKAFLQEVVAKDGVSGGHKDQKEHQALQGNASGEGEDKGDSGGRTLGSVGKE